MGAATPEKGARISSTREADLTCALIYVNRNYLDMNNIEATVQACQRHRRQHAKKTPAQGRRGAGTEAAAWRSAEAPGNVVFGFLAAGLDEDLVGFAEFHQLAQVHVGGVVGTARGLLHVVRHDDDGEIGRAHV